MSNTPQQVSVIYAVALIDEDETDYFGPFDTQRDARRWADAHRPRHVAARVVSIMQPRLAGLTHNSATEV